MEFIDKETIKAMAEAQGQEFDEEAERIRREQIERNYPKAGVVSVRIVDGMFEMYTVGESDESTAETNRQETAKNQDVEPVDENYRIAEHASDPIGFADREWAKWKGIDD